MGSRGHTGVLASGPVRATLFTVGTMRHTSTIVSFDTALVAGSISLMVGGSGKRDPDETVLAKIAEVAGGVAVGPEVVGIDRAKQRIVGIRIPAAAPLKQLEPRLGAGRRELEAVGRHVAVGARAAVRARPSGSGRKTRRPRCTASHGSPPQR